MYNKNMKNNTRLQMQLRKDKAKAQEIKENIYFGDGMIIL